jgi:polyisoprenoid-binding protein YceI
MKTLLMNVRLHYCLLLATAILWIPTTMTAQTSYQSKSATITIKGTSNVHDWEMKAANGHTEALITINPAGKVTAIKSLSFSIAVKNLKSEHTGMDNNTYKALKEKTNPNLTFVLTSATISETSTNNYMVKCTGQLTIAGKTNLTEIIASGVYNPADKSFVVSGLKKMKMTEYGVAPPKALLGTIKTGNEVSIGYTLKFTR